MFSTAIKVDLLTLNPNIKEFTTLHGQTEHWTFFVSNYQAVSLIAVVIVSLSAGWKMCKQTIVVVT